MLAIDFTTEIDRGKCDDISRARFKKLVFYWKKKKKKEKTRIICVR